MDQFYNLEHILSYWNYVYRTVTVSLNSINIFAQEQFGYGKGLSDVKILYNFIGVILSALNSATHSSGLSAELVRPFWLPIMTVPSKLHCYGFESHSGLCFELYHNDGQQTAVDSSEFALYLKLQYCKTYSSTGFHTCSHAFPHIHRSVKSQSIPKHRSSDTTDDRVSCIKNKSNSIQDCNNGTFPQVGNKGFKVNKYTYIRFC